MKEEDLKDKSVFTLDGHFIGWSIGGRYDEGKHILDIKIPVGIVETLPAEKAKKIEIKKRKIFRPKDGILSIDMEATYGVKDVIILRSDENLNEIEVPATMSEGVELKDRRWLETSIKGLGIGLENLKEAVSTIMPLEAEEKVAAEKISELMERRVQIQGEIEDAERAFMEGKTSEEEYAKGKKENKKKLGEVEEYLEDMLKRKSRLTKGRGVKSEEDQAKEEKKRNVNPEGDCIDGKNCEGDCIDGKNCEGDCIDGEKEGEKRLEEIEECVDGLLKKVSQQNKECEPLVVCRREER